MTSPHCFPITRIESGRYGGAWITRSAHGRSQREPSTRETLAREDLFVEPSDPASVATQSARRRMDDRVPNAAASLRGGTERRPDKVAIRLEKIIPDVSRQPWFHGEQVFCFVGACRASRDQDYAAQSRQAVSVLEARARMI